MNIKKKENETKTYIFNNTIINNPDISNTIIQEFKNDTAKNITIHVENDPIVSKEIFDAIINTDKELTIKNNDNEMIFKGKNIKEAKELNTAMEVNYPYETNGIAKNVINVGTPAALNNLLMSISNIVINVFTFIKT